MIDKNINDIEKDKEQMANIQHELQKNEGEYLTEFQQKPRTIPQFPQPLQMSKHIKRGDNGRYQSNVDMKSGRSSAVR